MDQIQVIRIRPMAPVLNTGPEHNNGTDINHPVCVQVGILIAFQKLQRWYVEAVNMTQLSCYLYTQG